ncbi:MAG: thiol peroxidase [Alkalispirochaetaceae bacterium]
MAAITFKGSAVETVGELPPKGEKAPDFTLTRSDLSDVSLEDFSGKKKILNIVPSLETGVCAASARRFEAEAGKLDNTVVLTISKDLPFAGGRFCQSEGISNVITLSQMRDESFGKEYGVTMKTGPLAGLLSRAVVVLNEQNEVIYTEQVPEIAQEPDYDRALEAVR